jgi:hypothetical protein
MKINLMEYRAEPLSELVVRIQVILRAIPGAMLVEVFLEWVKRLQRCIDTNGEYVGWAQSYQYYNQFYSMDRAVPHSGWDTLHECTGVRLLIGLWKSSS